jgi:RHS repeat-associated protein
MIRPSNRASIRNISDYSPFGVQLAERTISGDGYRFGFMGFERDNEVKGNGNSYTTEFRQYDPRLGRWLSVDPLAHKFAGWSPYVAFADNPIFFTDPDGRAPAGPGDRVKKPNHLYLLLTSNNTNGAAKQEPTIEQVQVKVRLNI